MINNQTNQLTIISPTSCDVQPQIIAKIPLKDAYRFFRTCTYAYNNIRPEILSRLSKWFTEQVWTLNSTFDGAVRRIVDEVAKCPSDARFANLFLRLFKPQFDNRRFAPDSSICLAAVGCDGGLKKADLSNSNISDASLAAIASNRELTTLSLIGCKGITDTGIQIIAQRCKKLADVRLSSTAISSKGVAALITYCPELTRLLLPYCWRITDDAMLPLATGCCPKLQELSFASCVNITDAALRSIANGCPGLSSLAVGNTAVTDNGIDTLVKACPNMRVLQLQSTATSDKSLHSIAAHSKNLRALLLVGCKGISDAGMQMVLDGCGSLTAVLLYGSGVSRKMENVVRATLEERRACLSASVEEVQRKSAHT